MSDAIGAPSRRGDRAHRLLRVYARTVAMLLLAAGLWRAGRILGMTPDGASFETLDPAWRAATVALASIDLFAAVGLWIGAAWGPVMWAVLVVVEVAMHTVLAERYGSDMLRVVAHVALVLGYVALVAAAWRNADRD